MPRSIRNRAFFNYFCTVIKRVFSAERPDVPNAARFLEEDPPNMEFRRWVMSHFVKLQELVSGSGLVNLVPGWHGTSERNIMNVCGKTMRTSVNDWSDREDELPSAE